MDSKYLINVKYGHCELMSWLEFDGETVIGMSSCASYDENGKLESFKIEPTGLTARFL